MVCINTHINTIQFKHFVEVPSSECVIGTAHDESNKIKLFLMVKDNGPIYKRNGLNNTWDELDQGTREKVRRLVKEGLSDAKIPYYTTNSLNILN